MTSLDGNVYVDFLGEFTAGIYGHSNEAIAAAVSEAMENGWSFGGPNPYERELAKKVCRRFAPSGVELVRFTNSGTESNTMAIAAAVAFTGRKKIVVFSNGYHGGTLSFPSNLNLEVNTNLPHEFVIAPYNDIEGTKALLATEPPQSIAAILVELVQGSGGCVPGTKAFLNYLDTTAHSLGALFIVDEVMTSRLSYYGLSSELGLRPDLVTLGKWVGGGMTFGAFGGRKKVMSLFDPRGGILSHSGTFNNNVVTMAAGCAGLDIYTEDEVKKLNALGESIKDSITSILKKYNITSPQTKSPCPQINELESPFTGIQSESGPSSGLLIEGVEGLSIASSTGMNQSNPKMWISGRGSMLNIHFSGESKASLKALFWHHMLDHGFYLAQRGFIALNIEINEEHAKRFVEVVERFVGRYKEALSS